MSNSEDSSTKSSNNVPWKADDDELRRVFIIQELASGDIDGAILVKNMELIFQWLKTGVLPSNDKKR